MQAMEAYAWPGNIRELVNVVERAVLLCEGPEVQPLDLPESIAAARQGEPAALATRRPCPPRRSIRTSSPEQIADSSETPNTPAQGAARDSTLSIWP